MSDRLLRESDVINLIYKLKKTVIKHKDLSYHDGLFDVLEGIQDLPSADKLKNELQIRCPKCGRTDYIKNLEKDFGVKDSTFKYKCINCNTYIKDEPQAIYYKWY